MANLKIKDGDGTEKFISQDGIGTDIDPFVGKRISVGLNPNGVYVNARQGGVSDDNSTTSTLGIGGVFNGVFVDTSGYSATSIFLKSDVDSAVNGLQIVHSSDGATDERIISFTYLTADNPQGLIYMIPASTKWFRLKYTNGAIAQTSFVASIKNETSALQTIALPINLPVKGGTLANVTKSVIIGEDSTGAFGNVSITETTNDAGTYKNLNVVSGARPSELAGRLKVSEVVDTTVSVLQRTITAGKTFFITDIILTIDNTDSANTGRVNLRDGLTVAGAIVLPLLIQESATNESAVQVVSHQFSEPMEFSTGLFVEEGVGINEVSGTIIGYEE